MEFAGGEVLAEDEIGLSGHVNALHAFGRVGAGLKRAAGEVAKAAILGIGVPVRDIPSNPGNCLAGRNTTLPFAIPEVGRDARKEIVKFVRMLSLDVAELLGGCVAHKGRRPCLKENHKSV